MKQIKASELFKDLCYNSQKSFNDEDKHLCPIVDELINENPNINYKALLEILKMHDEFIRLSLIKTIVQTLIDNKLIDDDIQIFNNKLIDMTYAFEVNRARKELQQVTLDDKD